MKQAENETDCISLRKIFCNPPFFNIFKGFFVMKYKLIALFFLSVILLYSQERETVSSIKTNNIKRYLNEGTRQYLVFTKKGESSESNLSLWSRTVRFQKIDSQERIVVQQQWYPSDSSANRTVYSICNADNFLPIYHYSSTPKNGIEAYDFLENKIIGSDTTQGNTKKGFSVNEISSTLNWELDLETFPLLDLRIGKEFSINFYHPGSNSAPQEYTYRVLDEERISVIGRSSIECWVLKINYNEKDYAMFWISKNGRDVVKMVEKYKSITRYKVLLSTAAIPSRSNN
jgi:hypothetical protein